MHDLGELKQFIGIRVTYDRPQRTLWLDHQAYIEEMAARYNIESSHPPSTPMRTEDLRPFSGTATPDSIHLYQQKVGSINYTAGMIRIDVARTVSRLAEFLKNPGPDQHRAADHCIR